MSIFLETNRLILREWEEEDIPLFAAMNQDPRVMRYFPSVLTPEQTAERVQFYRDQFRQYGFCFFAAELKETGEFIGTVGLGVPLFKTHFTPCVEIGWRLAHDYWGQGYATEAAKAVLATAFDRFGLQEIVAITAPDNFPSMHVMEKLGMQRDWQGDFELPPHPSSPKQEPVPCVLYRITADMVEALRQQESTTTLKMMVTHVPDPADTAVISNGIFSAYADLVGEPDRAFSVFLKEKSGKVVGGVQASFDTEQIYLKALWVEEACRHQGYGKKLLIAAEQEGLRQGCYLSTVDTWDFQAEGFYVENGYARIGEIKNYWKSHSMIFLRKTLKEHPMKQLIVILGHANDLSGQLSPIALSRLNKGLEVLTAHPKACILLTGGFGAHFNQTEKPHYGHSSAYLLEHGVAAAHIVEPGSLSFNTLEDAEKSKPVIEKINPEQIVLVTSEFHMARAAFIFKHYFPDRAFMLVEATSPLSESELAPLVAHEKKQLAKLKAGVWPS